MSWAVLPSTTRSGVARCDDAWHSSPRFGPSFNAPHTMSVLAAAVLLNRLDVGVLLAVVDSVQCQCR
jgi:hypothetical protein